MLSRVLAVLAVAVLAGCYQPSVADCTVTCTSETSCAEGQVCGADGWCAAPSIAGRCASVADAASIDGEPDHDAAVTRPDADQSACLAACSDGDCVDGVCVFTCGAGQCSATIDCPDGIPCRVDCLGDGSCAGGVDCHDATSCEVNCDGDDSCANQIKCHTEMCVVACRGARACGNETRCKDACSCDVVCEGPGSCAGGSECPMLCTIGAGCSSSLPGCDDC